MLGMIREPFDKLRAIGKGLGILRTSVRAEPFADAQDKPVEALHVVLAQNRLAD